VYTPKLEIPSQVRFRTLGSLALAFYRAQKDVTLSGIDTNALPFFVRKYLKRFFEVSQGDVKSALLEGDPWFFLSWRAKLAQIDMAMITLGHSVAERWALVRAQHMLSLMQMIASKRLVALGGTEIDGPTQISDPNGTSL